MPVGYHPLTPAERCPIHARLYRGLSKREMARDLGRDPATISRETSRNCGLRGDRHQPADGQATARRQEASAVPRKRTPEHWAVAEERLQEGWSPEQIAGWVRLPGEGMAGKEWIYPQVRADRQAGGALYRCLRRRGQKPNGRGGRPAGRGQTPDRGGLRWWPRRAGPAIGSGRSHRSSMRALPSLPPTIPGNGAGTSIPTAWYASTSRKGPTSAR